MRVPSFAALGLLVVAALCACGGEDQRLSDDDVAAIRAAERSFDRVASVRVETEIGALDGGGYTPKGCVTQTVDEDRSGFEDDRALIERRDEDGCGGLERATGVIVGDRIWTSRQDGRWRAGRLRDGLGRTLTPRRGGFADLVAGGTVVRESRGDDGRSWTFDVPADGLRAVADRLGTALPAGDVDVDTEVELRLDPAGRLARIELDVRSDGRGARTVTRYADYDAVDPILAPDADDVVGPAVRIATEAQLQRFARAAVATTRTPRLSR